MVSSSSSFQISFSEYGFFLYRHEVWCFLLGGGNQLVPSSMAMQPSEKVLYGSKVVVASGLSFLIRVNILWLFL
jgi:hypothetical protein